MVHYYDHIKNFGSPNSLCSSITESKHIAAVKCPWRRSNKHAALPQMLKVNERLDKIAAARADFAARGMLADSCLVQAIMAYSDEDSMQHEDASDSDKTDSEDSDDKIQISGLNYTSTQNSYDTHMRSLTNPDDPDDPDDTSEESVTDPDDDHPHTSQQPSPAPPNNEEDDDHGPVESGPLMNEVCLVGRKGQSEILHFK